MNKPRNVKSRDSRNKKKRGPHFGSTHNNYVVGALNDDQQLAAELLAEYLPEFLSKSLDWSKIQSEKTGYVDDALKNSVLDIAFSAPYQGLDERQRFLIVVEHKSKVDKRLALQLLRYCASVSEDCHTNGRDLPDGRSPWPLPILFYNGAKEWKSPPTLLDAVGAWKEAPCAQEFEKLFVPPFNYFVIDLASIKVEDLRGSALLRTFLEVTKRATDGTLTDAFCSLKLPWNFKKYDWSGYARDRLRKFFKRTFRYIENVARNMGKRVTVEDYQRVVDSVEDGNMRGEMKSFIDEFREQGLKKGRKQGLRRGRRQGLERGWKQGLEQGRKKEREMVQEYLSIHFGNVPQSLNDKISAINNSSIFNNFTRFAWRATSLNEIEQYLDNNPTREE